MSSIYSRYRACSLFWGHTPRPAPAPPQPPAQGPWLGSVAVLAWGGPGVPLALRFTPWGPKFKCYTPCRKSGALEQLFCGRASVAATGRNWCCTGLRTRTV